MTLFEFLNLAQLSPVLDVETRWNSAYAMMLRATQVKPVRKNLNNISTLLWLCFLTFNFKKVFSTILPKDGEFYLQHGSFETSRVNVGDAPLA